jgi:hypothetical protein
MGTGKGLAIVALIMGASGLGLGATSFIIYQVEISKPSGSVIVGLWESLYLDTDNPSFPLTSDCLIEVGDEKILNSDYFTLNQTIQHNNTRFHLKRRRCYRINIHLFLASTSSALGWYQMFLWKNGILYSILLQEASINNNIQVNRQIYIDSDGNDYFEINCYSFMDSFFSPEESQQAYNQLAIEYAGVG